MPGTAAVLSSSRYPDLRLINLPAFSQHVLQWHPGCLFAYSDQFVQDFHLIPYSLSHMEST